MSGDNQMFTPGSQVMVPFHGLCEVVGVSREEILGEQVVLIELEPLFGSNTVIKIPESQMEARGARLAASAEEMRELLEETTTELEQYVRTPPHRRMKNWSRLLRSGRPGCRKELLALMDQIEQAGDKLSKSEQELREQVRLAFRHEVEAALDISAQQAGRKINEAIDLASGTEE